MTKEFVQAVSDAIRGANPNMKRPDDAMPTTDMAKAKLAEMEKRAREIQAKQEMEEKARQHKEPVLAAEEIEEKK